MIAKEDKVHRSSRFNASPFFFPPVFFVFYFSLFAFRFVFDAVEYKRGGKKKTYVQTPTLKKEAYSFVLFKEQQQQQHTHTKKKKAPLIQLFRCKTTLLFSRASFLLFFFFCF